jgi:hypothetical protein
LYSGVPEDGSMDKEISGEKITQILEETRIVIPGTEIFLATASP